MSAGADDCTRRTEFLLGRVFDDLKGGTIDPLDDKAVFVQKYMNLVANHTHATHVYIQVVVDAGRSSKYKFDGVIEGEFYDWLNAKKPTIEFVECFGKHSQVDMKWHELGIKTDDDHFKVEENMHKGVPDDLEYYHAEWKREKEARTAKVEGYLDSWVKLNTGDEKRFKNEERGEYIKRQFYADDSRFAKDCPVDNEEEAHSHFEYLFEDYASEFGEGIEEQSAEEMPKKRALDEGEESEKKQHKTQ